MKRFALIATLASTLVLGLTSANAAVVHVGKAGIHAHKSGVEMVHYRYHRHHRDHHHRYWR